jgi:hypothetical protein
VTTFYIYVAESLEYLGTVEAADMSAASQLAQSVWGPPLKVLSWRLRFDRPVAA